MKQKLLTDLAERVDKVCADKRLNHNELAKVLEVTSTTIYQIISGRTKQLSMELLTKFYQKLNVSMIWLTTGEGEVYTKSDSKPSKPIDGGNFGEQVLNEVSKGIDELKGLFEEELRAKNLQIASLQETQKSLQEMLRMVLGKPNSVPRRPNLTPPVWSLEHYEFVSSSAGFSVIWGAVWGTLRIFTKIQGCN